MNKPPMSLDTDAFLADTTHLGTTEIGAYSLLLMAMWRSADGWLAADDRYLSRATRLTLDKWRRIAPTIRALLKQEGDRVTQKRIQKDRRLSADAGSPCENPREDSGNAAKPLKNIGADSKPAIYEKNASFLLTSSDSENRKKERKKTRVVPLPKNWIPDDAERIYGRTVLKLTDAQIDAAAEKMRRWAINNSHRSVGRKLRWDLAFRNWLDSDAERKQDRSTGGSNGQRQDRSASRAAGELAERLRSGEVSIAPRPTGARGLLGGSGEASVRLISPGRSE